jgi:hypothetical protein
MIEIIPVAATNVAWSSYLKTVLDHTGKNIVKKIDLSPFKLSAYEKFIISFDELSIGSAATHIHFSFIILLPAKMLLELYETAKLNITSVKALKQNHRLVFITGSLEEWGKAIPIINSELAPTLLSFFNQAGLKSYFKETKKLK